MKNLMDLLQSQMGEQAIDLLASQYAGGKKKETQAATQGIVSMLMTALAKNASTPEGANALVSAIDRDHDGSVLNDVAGLLQKKRSFANDRTVNGEGIIKHVLGTGQKKENAMEMISRMSGLDKNNVGSMMSQLAPLVLGALGKARHEQNMGVSDLVGFLGSSVKSKANNDAQMGLIGKFLDKDGDGSVLDDLASMGMDALRRR